MLDEGLIAGVCVMGRDDFFGANGFEHDPARLCDDGMIVDHENAAQDRAPLRALPNFHSYHDHRGWKNSHFNRYSSSGIFPNGSGLLRLARRALLTSIAKSEPAGTNKPERNGAEQMSARVLLLASVSASLLAESG